MHPTPSPTPTQLILMPLDEENTYLHLTCMWSMEKQEKKGKQEKEVDI